MKIIILTQAINLKEIAVVRSLEQVRIFTVPIVAGSYNWSRILQQISTRLYGLGARCYNVVYFRTMYRLYVPISELVTFYNFFIHYDHTLGQSGDTSRDLSHRLGHQFTCIRVRFP